LLWRHQNLESDDLWLEFMPTNTPDSIFVPLRRVHWEWSGEAVAAYGVWVLSTSTCITNPTDIEELNFPEWTNLIDMATVPYHLKQ
jgi:hypothetical protein